MTLDPQAIGLKMTYVLVGFGALFFAFVFFDGSLTRQEKKQAVVILVLFIVRTDRSILFRHLHETNSVVTSDGLLDLTFILVGSIKQAGI